MGSNSLGWPRSETPYYKILGKLSQLCERSQPIVIEICPRSDSLRPAETLQRVEQLVEDRRSLLAIATGKSFARTGNAAHRVNEILREIVGNLSYCHNMHAIGTQIVDFCDPSGDVGMGDWPIIFNVTGWTYSAAFILLHQHEITDEHHWIEKHNRILGKGELRNSHKLFFGRDESSAICFQPKQYRWAQFGGNEFSETPQIKIIPSDRIGFDRVGCDATAMHEQRITVGADGFDSDELVGEQILPYGTQTRMGKIGVQDLRVVCTRFIPRQWNAPFWKGALIDQLLLTFRWPDLALTQVVLAQGRAEEFFWVWPSVDEAVRKLVRA